MTQVLVDTSVWVDHLRRGEPDLVELLEDEAVLLHGMVIGELACGQLPQRAQTLQDLQRMPRVMQADEREVLDYLEQQQLMGSGLGWVDMHLLAAARLTPGARLWSKDRRLSAAARLQGLAWFP